MATNSPSKKLAALFMAAALMLPFGAGAAFGAEQPAEGTSPKASAPLMRIHAVKSKSNAKKYSIIYKLNGGKNPSKQTLALKARKVLAVSNLKKPTRTGYSFAGWYTDKKLTKKAKRVKGVKRKSDRTLYAKWALKTFKIDYELDGGKLVGNYVKRYAPGQEEKLPTPVRPGYSFSGWYSNSKLSKGPLTSTKSLSGAKTLYAKWEPLVYSIAYILDGGTLSDDAQKTYTAISPVDTLPVPTKDGYLFVGWYSDAEFTNLVVYISEASRGNKVLYACWRENAEEDTESGTGEEGDDGGTERPGQGEEPGGAGEDGGAE